MTDMQDGKVVKEAAASGAQPPSEVERSVYNYESAGITEREGNVPVWLWIVVVSLALWGIYYLVTYWNAPVTPP